MLKRMTLVAVALWCAPALAQFGPPEGGGSISLAPPTNTSPVPDRVSRVEVFLPNRTYTVNAQIGYVNSQPIFATDIFRPIDASLRRIAADPHADFIAQATQLIHAQLTATISDVVVVSAAEATITEDDKKRAEVYINLERNTILTENGGSEATAEAALEKAGSSLSNELAKSRREFIKHIYFQRRIYPRIQITRDMALAVYEKNPKDYQEPAKIELYTITLPVSRWLREAGTGGVPGPVKANPSSAEIAGAEAQAMTVARDLLTQLKHGADFAVLAEDNNPKDSAQKTGGRWGIINIDSLSNAQLRDAATKMHANSLGDPLLLHDADFRQSSVVIVKIGQKTEANTIPFEKAQKKITDDLTETLAMQLQEQEMTKLEKEATFEAVDRMQNVAVEAAATRYATH